MAERACLPVIAVADRPNGDRLLTFDGPRAERMQVVIRPGEHAADLVTQIGAELAVRARPLPREEP